jgi:hypothetical protein
MSFGLDIDPRFEKKIAPIGNVRARGKPESLGRAAISRYMLHACGE